MLMDLYLVPYSSLFILQHITVAIDHDSRKCKHLTDNDRAVLVQLRQYAAPAWNCSKIATPSEHYE